MSSRILFVLLGISSASTAYAGSIDFVPLQQRALGQSLTAASLLNDSLFANPASSAFTNVYSLDGTFLSPQTFSASVLDTKTSGFGGGLAYFRLTRPGYTQLVQGGKLGFTARLGQYFGLGAVGKMVWGPNTSGGNGKYGDVDVGALLQFSFIQFGLSVANLAGGSVSMGETREYALGTQLNWERTLFFSAAVTGATSTFQPLQYGFGAEYVSPYYFALKGGYRLLPVNPMSYWSAGVSVLAPRVSIHYAVEFQNVADGTVQHSVGTTFLF